MKLQDRLAYIVFFRIRVFFMKRWERGIQKFKIPTLPIDQELRLHRSGIKSIIVIPS